MFINVTETYTTTADDPWAADEGIPDYPGVTNQDVFIDEGFANGLHDSCAGVIFPQTNSKYRLCLMSRTVCRVWSYFSYYFLFCKA